MNFQNDKPTPESLEEAEDRMEWLVTAAGDELEQHWSESVQNGGYPDRRLIDFLRHMATTCRRTANYLERQAIE